MSRAKKQGDIIQLLGLIIVSFGIVVEFIYKADIGFWAISSGSLIFAIGTKIKGR